LRICVFPNDPIKSYYKKGEIKERYYNPENFFDEIHIITLTDKDVEESKIQKIAGNAKLTIHKVGKITIKNRKKNVDRIIQLVKDIEPQVIRAYNPYIEGWLAANCSKKLRIPFYLSLHTQYDFNRKLAKKTNLKKYLALKYTEKFVEPFVLKSANRITIVFKIIEPYVIRHTNTKPKVLYNRIDFKRFANSSKIQTLSQPLIISVGNLVPVKNHECLIHAVNDLDANLLIIGSGVLLNELTDLILKLGVEKKVQIIQTVPHEKIQDYYKSAQLFALAHNTSVEGLPMPVMEAMATGIPVVISTPKEGFSDGLEDVAIFSKPEPESFAKKIKKLLENSDLREKLGKKCQDKAKEFDDSIIEKREAEIYLQLVNNKKLEL